jgi:hypothetical protein
MDSSREGSRSIVRMMASVTSTSKLTMLENPLFERSEVFMSKFPLGRFQ